MNKNRGVSALKDLGSALLGEGKTLKIRAEGFSMYPTVKPGSMIYIEPVDNPDELEPDTLIAWKRDSGFVVHRLLRKFKKEEHLFFVTRGDCNLHEDSPFKAEKIAGKVVKLEYPEGSPVTIKSYKNKKPNYLINRLSVITGRILGSL